MKNTGDKAYNDAIEWLESFIDYERIGSGGLQSDTYTLAPFRAFMEHLDNPQNKVPSIHIAGTRGKGSTGTLLSTLLTAAGYKVGLYTSPHIYEYRERIQVSGEWISRREFAAVIEELREQCSRCGAPEAQSYRTVFEFLTAAFFLHCARERVDYAVVETGLGGRLDATNIILPEIAVITKIAFEHQHLLGDSIEEIAREKAGIIKEGRPVVLGKQYFEQVHDLLCKSASERNAPLVYSKDIVKIINRHIEPARQRIMLSINKGEPAEFITQMRGLHQVENIQTALATCVTLLEMENRSIPLDALKKGVERWTLPGRTELFSERPPIILDGAHCPISLEALLRTVHELYTTIRPVFVMAVMKDKSAPQLLEIISRQYPQALIVTYTAPIPRGLPSEDLAAIAAGKELDTRPFPSITSAVRYAIDLTMTKKYDIFIHCGTFYTIATLKELLYDELDMESKN